MLKFKLVLQLSLLVGLVVNWGFLSDDVEKLESALSADDIQSIPEWVAQSFNKYAETYGRKYDDMDRIHRMKVYYKNIEDIRFNNEDLTKEYVLGENEFLDIDPKEFREKYLMQLPQRSAEAEKKRQEAIRIANSEPGYSLLQTQSTPPTWDWRQKGGVSDLKNQGKCGSCWSFSTTQALEGHSFIKSGAIKPFAQQHLIDCCQEKDNCYGCDGAWPIDAFAWVQKNGIATETEYKTYQAKKGTCGQQKGAYKITGADYVPQKVIDLKNAVVRQPISVVIDASKWQFYKFGVFDGCPDGSDIDHAVLLVGYDAEGWIVKNSWGSKWGDGGYIRLKMGNQCGILNEAVYPFL